MEDRDVEECTKEAKGVDPALQKDNRNQTATGSPSVHAQSQSSSKYHRARSGGARDERYRSDIHTEAVQAALAKHKEQKMALPMPTKRRSTFVQSPADACTPPDTSSASEDEGSLRRQAALSAVLAQSLQNTESWINKSVQGSSTSSSASSTLSHGDVKSTSSSLADMLSNIHIVSQRAHGKKTEQVALVYPNNDPVMFMVAFYGCLLAEVIPVPIEVPLTRKDAGGHQIGFLLGSCGVKLALTTEVCLKGLPKTQNGEIVQFKGWPKLKWVVTDSRYLTKAPKDWQPHITAAGTEPAYIEYKTSKEGSVMGVTVSRIAMLSHCQAVSQACNYTEGETMVNVLDFKRDAGLWHGMITNVVNKMHTFSVPYSVMKACPLSWVQRVHAHKARVAVVKCRDLHWAMIAHREQKDISLASLRMLIVTDGANPWSVSSCDAFLSLFQNYGLKPEAICPCATSPEAMTVAIRRPGVPGAPLPGRAILSMNGLSYGVIRVNTEDKNSALTVQDVGHVMPGGVMCIIKPEGLPQLCKTDEIGEICVSYRGGGISYYGLAGVTKNTFEVLPVSATGTPVGDTPFTRTGLLGFVGPGSLVFVVGKMDGTLMVSGRRHNADDIVATALAVESFKTLYRGRIAVFSVTVFYDERIVVVAEQRPDASEEDSFQWMSRVLQAIDSIHQAGVYCLALVPANTLPKTPLGGIHLSQTKQHFLEGTLHPCNILMCPHTCVTNLPKPRQKQPGVGPASVMVGNLVAGKRIAQASGRDLGQIEENDMAKKMLGNSRICLLQTQALLPVFALLHSGGAMLLLTMQSIVSTISLKTMHYLCF
ncbi:hypothetical protein AB205_0074340 [Aquarana catesbeiana]|uniref:DMAP1-binding domain-containing protein n=1 Tax=Aquarana catesbeiana TaxID=8400 RepID=A0A2G9SC80_AQUCT|nr:hypothetical protein AB205_0074340 [Aquarana catesbeiana]